MQATLYSLMHQLQSSRTAFAVATVVATRGSVSAKLGAKAVINAEGQLLAGWVGGGCAESQCQQTAVTAIKRQHPLTLEIDLDDEILGVGMPCGGAMTVFIEPVLPAPTLWILGHSRIAQSLCMQGKELGFRVVINDPLAATARFPGADELVADDLDYALLRPQASDYVVLATQHKGDHDALAQLLKTEVGYIGLIASRKRAQLMFDYCKNSLRADPTRLRTPCGIDLGAQTPEEIAQSILAEITLLRRQGSGASMSAAGIEHDSQRQR